ncbi:MAG: ATP-binding cassette domain-containing protein, partial [Spirochaetaceae bacterium]
MSNTTGHKKIIEVRNLGKKFGSLSALAGITFDLKPGEVMGIVGQPGSGKSTLFSLLSGMQKPSTGTIRFLGSKYVFRSPVTVRRAGIQTIYQTPQLVENLSVIQNIYLGHEIKRPKPRTMMPDDNAMYSGTEKILEKLSVHKSLLYEKIANFSNEQRQIIAIARALCQPASLLLMDDPMAPLSYDVQEKVMAKIHELAKTGVAVILNSYDMKHIFAVTDKILVLFQGQQIALLRTDESTPQEIVELIVGSSRKDQITPVIWAFEQYHAAQKQAEELKKTQAFLRQSLEQQDSLNRQLIVQLRSQLSALDTLNIALQDASRRLLTEREAERKALAREIHDQIIQDLLGYNFQIEEAEQGASDPEQKRKLQRIRFGIRDVVAGLRQVCSDLRPPTIDNHGLSAAISSFVSNWTEYSGINVELKIDSGLGRLPEAMELSVFRIIQEAMSNVKKHSGADMLELSVQRTHTSSLVLLIRDNGN